MQNSPKKKSKESGLKRKKPTQTAVKHSGKKQIPDEPLGPSLNELAEKASKTLTTLGNQTFALSPFSQYYADWLLNVRSVISDFKSNLDTVVDEQFEKESSKIFTDIEKALADCEAKDISMQESAKKLSELNAFLSKLDVDYTSQIQTLNQKKDREIERLTKAMHNFEEEQIIAEKMKTSFFSPTSKRIKAQKIADVKNKLNLTKNELESAKQNFSSEQAVIHDEYMKKKMANVGKLPELENEIANIEVDLSKDNRQKACNDLKNSVDSFIKRAQASS
ncbi:MAG: hypothetical protein GX638_02005 [Crenarchaeota archaeon]|nr:hypothetical protein [Thermoproteota archaeon]